MNNEERGLVEPRSIEEAPPSNLLSGLIRELGKIDAFIARHTDPVTTDEFVLWARREHIAPENVHLVFRHASDATLELFDEWVAYSCDYLGNDEGVKYIEEWLGGSLGEASDDDKLEVLRGNRPAERRARDVSLSLQERKKHGAYSLRLEVKNPDAACRRCQIANGAVCGIDMAISYEEEMTCECSRVWHPSK